MEAGQEDCQQCLQDFANVCRKSTPDKFDCVTFRDSFHRVCCEFAAGSLTLENVTAAWDKEQIQKLPLARVVVVDTLWACGTQFTDEEKKTFAPLVKYLGENGISTDLMQERLDLEMLTASAIVDTRFSKAFNKYSTQKQYSQCKFNLFREANEGYSKLLLELVEVHTTRKFKTSPDVDLIIRKIQTLIGYFKLDPYRVHALVLDAYEHDVDNPKYLRLLKSFQTNQTAVLLGFQFRHQAKAGGKGVDGRKSPANSSRVRNDAKNLYTVTATLIKHGVLSLNDIYHYLSPEDGKVVQEYKKYLGAKVAEVRKFGMVNLREDSATRNQNFQSEIPVPASHDENNQNQKLNLLVALLAAEAFDPALDVLRMLSAIDPIAYPPVFNEVCAQAGALMEPLYAPISHRPLMDGSPTTAAPPAPNKEQVAAFSKYGFPLILACGHYLSGDVELLTKLCRVMRSLLTLDAGVVPGLEEWVEKLGIRVLLPSMALMAPNPSFCYEFWDAIKSLSYEQRFRIYGTFQAEGYEPPNYRLLLARIQVQRETSNICRRIAKEATKSYGRGFAKIAHCNPLVGFEKIVEQAMAYDNVIACLVDLVRYVTPLGMDILVYQLLVEVCQENKSRMSDATTYAGWLQHLGTFAGTFYRKYHSLADLQPLLHYLLHKIRSSETSDLVIVQELLRNMTGFETMETNINDSQLLLHAGGPSLRFTFGGYAQTLNTNVRMLGKASKRLRDKLVAGGMAAPILLLLAQLRATHQFEHAPDDDENKMQKVSEVQDQVTNTLSLMVQFLTTVHPKEPKEAKDSRDTSARDKDRDKDRDSDMENPVGPESGDDRIVLPKMHTMIQDFNIEPEVAFALTRHTLKERPVWKEEEVRETLGDIGKFDEYGLDQVLLMRVYYLFWTLDLYDIYVPTEGYTETIDKLKKDIADQEDKKNTAGRKDKDKDKETAVLKEDLASIETEYRDQLANNKTILARLQEFRDANSEGPLGGRHNYEKFFWVLLQVCILPRCTMSMLDAIYCGEFIKMLHKLQLPTVNLLVLFHQITTFAPRWLAFTTECEAQRVGRFLAIIIEMLLRWRMSQNLYEKECLNHPGFRDNPKIKSSSIPFATLKTVHQRLHEKLTRSFIRCLGSSELFERRNCLLVLGRIKDVYPQLTRHCKVLVEKIESLKSQPGLKSLADSCITLLSQRKSNAELDKEDDSIQQAQQAGQSSDKKERRDDKDKRTVVSRTSPAADPKRKERESDLSSSAKKAKDGAASPIPKPKVDDPKGKSSSAPAALKPKDEKKGVPSAPSTAGGSKPNASKPLLPMKDLKEEDKKVAVKKEDAKDKEEHRTSPRDAGEKAAVKKPPSSSTSSAASVPKKEDGKPSAAPVKREGDSKSAPAPPKATTSVAPKKEDTRMEKDAKDPPKRKADGGSDGKDHKRPKTET